MVSRRRIFLFILLPVLLTAAIPAVRSTRRILQFYNPRIAVMTREKAADRWEALEAREGADRARAWNRDLTVLARELEKRHKDPYHRVSREQFKERIENLRREIPSCTDREMFLGIKELVALIGDGHTQVTPPVSLDRLPLGLREYEEGIYIASCPEDNRSLLGTRLIGIEGQEAGQIRKALYPLMSHDNDVDLASRSLCGFSYPDYLYYAGLESSGDAYTIEGQRADGSEVVEILSEVKPEDFSSLRDMPALTAIYPAISLLPSERRNREWYWYEYFPGENLVYFQYDRCRDQDENPLEPFLDKLTVFLKETKGERLLVDLRYNGGGSSPLLDPLIEALAGNPRDLGEGGVYVAVGRNTYSSAVLNALSLRDEAKAIVIGEPSGGGASHYGEVRSFNLPRSGIYIHYSTKYFNRPGGDGPIIPDIPINYSFADYCKGKDPVLEYLAKQE